MGEFIFGGKRSDEFGLVVEHRPKIAGTARKRTTVSVAGRNGDLHIDEGAYENYKQPYQCGFFSPDHIAYQAHLIQSWLQSAGANTRLEDSYDPDCFRLATFAGPADIENHLNKIGKCTIIFDCDPRAFLKSGEHPLTFEAPTILYNLHGFPALPLITVYGTGPGTLTVGDVTVEIKALDDHITLDSDLQDAYRVGEAGDLESKNGAIYAPDYPVLAAGENAVSWTGDITKVEIIPRWWTL